MRNHQKAKLKQPVIALLLNSKDNARKIRQRESSQVKSRKSIKIIQTRSDNRGGLKGPNDFSSINNLRSQKILRNYQQKIQQLDQYGMQRNLQDFKSHKVIDNKYNQCLRDQDQSSQHEQIMSHYRRSKSRYKNAKDKAKKLIENLRSGSRNRHTQQSQNQTQNQDYFKLTEKKQQLIYNNSTVKEDYDMEIRSIGKASSTSSFRPKKQKSSTIKWKKQELSKMLKKSSLNISQSSVNIQKLDQKNQKEHQKNYAKKQTTSITNTTSVGGSSNNLFVPGENMVIKAKQLMSTQYGIVNYSDKKKNNLESITQKKDQTLSHKMLATQKNQKDSQKLLHRSRQKNKKIIGKLREKTSCLRVPDYDQLLNPNKYSTKAKNIFQVTQKQNQKTSNEQISMLNSNFLMLNSKLNKSQTYVNQEIKQKILIHLETLNMIGDYAQSFRNIYDDCEEWEQLIFLLYKKYYIQRMKVYMIMRNGCIKFEDLVNAKKSKNNDYQQKVVQTDSPFVFDFCKVTIDQLNSFRESKEQVSLQLEVQNYNKSIKVALRQLYNQFIEKTSKNSYINMYEVDDFSQEIIEDLNEEINMLIQSSGKSRTLKKRINLAIQIGLIVAYLGGYYLEQIQDIVTGQVQKSEFYNKYYSRFMSIFEQNQKNGEKDQQ